MWRVGWSGVGHGGRREPILDQGFKLITYFVLLLLHIFYFHFLLWSCTDAFGYYFNKQGLISYHHALCGHVHTCRHVHLQQLK